jgi:hypothetical protein
MYNFHHQINIIHIFILYKHLLLTINAFSDIPTGDNFYSLHKRKCMNFVRNLVSDELVTSSSTRVMILRMRLVKKRETTLGQAL